jgi:hypothetical protein
MDWAGFILQVIGSFLLAKKKKLAWVFFTIGNIIWISYFIVYHPDMFVEIVQTFFFILLDLFGLYCWFHDLK